MKKSRNTFKNLFSVSKKSQDLKSNDTIPEI